MTHPTVVLVGVDDDLVGCLRSGVSGLDASVVVVDDFDETLRHVAAGGVVTVVIGPSSAALPNVRRVRQIDDDVPVLVIADQADFPELDAAARVDPLIGRSTHCARPDPDALAELLADTACWEIKRREHHRVLRQIADVQLPAALAHPATTAQYLGQLLDHATIGVVTIDTEGTIQGWNPKAEAITGRRPEDAIGTSIYSLFPASEAARLRAALEQAARSTEAITEVVSRLGPHGVEQHLELTTASIDDGLGQLGNLVLIHDVTDRERANLELAAQAQAAKLAADVGMALTSLDNVDQQLQRCADAIVEHLDAAFARIWSLESGGDVLVLRASAGLYTDLDGAHARIPVGQYKIGLIARECRPHVTNQVVGDPRVHDQDWALREGMVAFAGYPLVLGGRCVGVLGLFARHELTRVALTALGSIADSIAVGLVRAETTESLERQSAQLRAVADVAAAASELTSLEEVLPFITRAARDIIGAHRAVTTLSPAGDPSQAIRAVALSDEYAARGNDEIPDGSTRCAGLRQDRELLAAPLTAPDGSNVGHIELSDKYEAQFSAQDDAILAQLAQLASATIHRSQLEQERARVTEELKRPLTPPPIPPIPGLDVAASYQPYGDVLDVGGDFYDVFDVPGARWAFVVGDISGKGPGAAALTGLARQTLWAAGRAWGEPAEMLRLLNDAILRQPAERFCTAVVAVGEVAGGTARLRLSIGGHPPPLLLRSDGRTSRVTTASSLVGILDDVHFPTIPVVLHQGDALVMYTDGLTEGGGSHAFDDDDLLAVLGGLAGQPASAIVEGLVDAALERRSVLRDDLAILAVVSGSR